MDHIAIIGLGCRFPSANNPEAFWQLLHNGVDAITEVPPERWNVGAFYAPESATSGKMNTRWGGFLEQVKHFDVSFFGISPREAEPMDPQQRLVLEVTWEALENAAIVPEKLSNSQTGVFIGICNADYHRLVYKDFSSINAYSGTGTSFCIAANRISYLLNLKGPSLAIDTACSSSLIAVHYACQSLQSGESNLCLAGGVNLILSPEQNIIFSQAKMMAADGRCKTFDASADGYVRGEGCGLVVLKRLSDALRDGDNIQAIIKGSAVNQDGLTNGLTAPSGLSQQSVIRQALNNAGVAPAQISYVEAHGTGTSLGDPIEFKSLKTVLMEGRSLNQPCWIGSVKTNIGHLEASAGIASLIKVILSLQHRKIPPHLHLNQLNPYVAIEGTPFAIPTECQSWSADGDRRLAGVSAFGFGGTNCHVIVEEAPGADETRRQGDKETVERPLHLLTLSAKNEKALKELVQSYSNYLKSETTSLADVCFTANTGRTHFECRLAVVAQSPTQLQEKLEGFQTGQESSGLLSGKVANKKSPKIAFLFTGQGSQYIGMGHQLYKTQPIFRDSIERCQEILRPYLEKPLLEVLFLAEGEKKETSFNLLDETAYTQPALFALEYALAQLWQSWGIKPAAVMGHSVGEYIAACIAGVFSLEDGLKLIAQRACLMQALPQEGDMVVVFADEKQVAEAIQDYSKGVGIAAFNGPENIVISGKRQFVEAAIAAFTAKGIKTKKLSVSHAFHSPLMQPMMEAFAQVAKEVTYSPPKINLLSNLTGKFATAEIATPDYWCRHILEPVKFAASMEVLQQQGYEVFVEVGSKPTLLGMGRAVLEVGKNQPKSRLWLSSLRPGREDWQQILESLAALYVQGVAVDWSGFEQDDRRRRLSLPTYPFQRQQYWFEVADNEQQKADDLRIDPRQTSIFKLIEQGNSQQLVQQLLTADDFSAEEVTVLSKLVDSLVKQHQQELSATALSNGHGAPHLPQKESSLSKTREKLPESLNREQLLAIEPEKRQQLLKSYFSGLLAKVTGIAASDLNWQQQLSSLGMDSLMATELRKRLETDWEVLVPVEYFASLSIDQFLEQVLLSIEGKSAPENRQPINSSFPLESSAQANLWLPRLASKPQASVRLFCFAYAGAGASVFNAWLEEVPPEIEICPIQLPGREIRLGESPFTRLKPLIQTLTPLLQPYLDLPFAFFGHSLGALLSFEVARELRRQNWTCPVHLFVSGSRAPQIPDWDAPIHALPDPKFKEALQRIKGTPEEVLQNAELMELFLPALRADFALLETYFYTTDKPLDCPISAFGGLQDHKVSHDTLAAWEAQTSSRFALKMFPGEHFFLHGAQTSLVQAIAQEFQKLLTCK